MDRNRSKHELKRLVEDAVKDICNLEGSTLWFAVDELEVEGHPPSMIRVWATLRFLPRDELYCCQEPMCHLGLQADRLFDVEEHVQHAMRLKQKVSVSFGNRIRADIVDGANFDPSNHIHGKSHPFPCPCCGYLTSPDDWDICPVCFWENDPFQQRNPDSRDGANKVSLRQGQCNFEEFGACEREMLEHVRPDGFQREPNWKPLNPKIS